MGERDDLRGCTVVVRRSDGRYLLLRNSEASGASGAPRCGPPAGLRRPGEPVLAGAVRILAEQTGIEADHVWPVDLSGRFAVLATEVADDVSVTLGAQHDQVLWQPVTPLLSGPESAAVSPATATVLRRVAAVPGARLGFRPLTREDLPLMVDWQRAPHAELWFSPDLDLASAHEQYGPRIDGRSAVRVCVLLVDGQPQGFLQHYRVGDHAAYAEATGTPDAVGIDYLIGERRLVGRGLGPAVIWQFLREVVLPAHPEVTRIVASPDVDNERSLRALDKAGFQRVRPIPTRDPEMLCIAHRADLFGV